MTRGRLLIVDDDADLVRYFAAVAKLSGFETLLAHNGVEALALVDDDLTAILLDLAMPRMDGIQLLRQLGRLECRAGIILVSGFERQVLESARLLATARGLHVVGSLSKPVAVQALKDLLAAAVSTPLPRRAERPRVTADDLRRAIEEQQLVLHYQPQVALDSGAWIGVEALVRWRHPEHGLLYPDAFIGIAERDSALSAELTSGVIRMATRDSRETRHGLGRERTLSINVSPVGLTDLDFPEMVDTIVSRLDLDKRKLRFEVTETSIAEHPETLLDILTRLRIKGYTLSIDDFGTGHSTFENLRELPLEELKIDMSFVRAGPQDPVARVIVEKSVGLGHELGLKVIAEGVEDATVWRWLRGLQCDVAQGYFVAKPMAVDALTAWQQGWLPPSRE